jgi:hypothetical protein
MFPVLTLLQYMLNQRSHIEDIKTKMKRTSRIYWNEKPEPSFCKYMGAAKQEVPTVVSHVRTENQKTVIGVCIENK